MVDAPDSKSGAPRGACRFEPDLRYRETPAKSRKKQDNEKRLGALSEPLYTNYYTNAL